ncbi:hypothetical protein [Streptomyces rimosus]|uniref:hypothetical protein n=1 Tax=Streptomyces rimosus TaxID=1927 RepID=UPI00131E3CCA|nr:hypothetical protein [Streptomyces rimosus]
MVLNVRDGHGSTARLRFTLNCVDDSRSAFLLGLARTSVVSGQREIDSVLESVAVE